MSANATDPGTVSSSVAPPSLNAIIHPSLNSLMLSHTFSSLLIPLFISLFYFSTPQGRRKLIFIFNVAAILLAFAVGVLCDGVAVSPTPMRMADRMKSSHTDSFHIGTNESVAYPGALFTGGLLDAYLMIPYLG